MLTFDDCLGLCDLTEEEVAAIAEHEHLPMIVAAELGNYLIHGPDGALRVKRIIVDDIRHAASVGDMAHVLALKLVLRHFVETHPECRGRAGAARAAKDETVRRFLERIPGRPAMPKAS
jgi:hypothetical protein